MVATSSVNRQTGISVPSRQRSRITNGRLLPGDNRGPWARRAKDIIAAHLSDIPDASTAVCSIIRRAAVMTVELEALESKFATGDASPADLDLYIRGSGNLRRLLEAIGLERRSKDVTGMSLSDLRRLDLAEQRAEATPPEKPA